MKNTLTVSLLLVMLASWCFAQKPLTNSRQSSFYTYIYKITPADMLTFYKHPDKSLNDQILHTPVDSVKTDKYWENTLPAGNYIKALANKNGLKYALIENHSAFVKILSNNYDQRFVFFDKEGNSIRVDEVKFNNRNVSHDNISKTYHIRTSKKNGFIEADYAGVANFFELKQEDDYEDDNDKSWPAVLWDNVKKIFNGPDNNHNRYVIKHDYNGFVVFNKPIYRPNDTVRLKAFIVGTKSRIPIVKKQLLVRLKENYSGNEKTIGIVNSYRDGSFVYNFVLNDKLKLKLDWTYTIMLEDPDSIKIHSLNGERNDNISWDGHKVLIRGSFKYEDYELRSIKFSARIDKKNQVPGDEAAIYLKAVDENDLPVPDGRVELALITYSATRFESNHAFVPDTLWTHKLQLDPLGETKVIIPDSIFPKANIYYRINAGFLNSSNEHHVTSLSAWYKYDKYNITTELVGDTLNAKYRYLGKETKAAAVVSALSKDDDTISKVKVVLPASIIIRPYAVTYNIETDSTDTDFDLKDENPDVSLSADRTADSILVKVNNPRNLHFWYSVFAGSKLIDAGEANQLFYKKAYGKQKRITFLVNYIWGNEIKSTEANELVYRTDKLNIIVKQPVTIYPGQQVQTDIVVTNIAGKSVANTDLTAWSLTSKFNNYRLPYTPYLGRPYPSRRLKKTFEPDELDAGGTIKLNWIRWAREMGLDSIVYYQFTHPTGIYRMEEQGIDTITQIAPFIVKDGDVIPVHILYIDEKPVYFSQAQQLQRYSFMVKPGLHSLRFRTSRQNIKLDSVFVEKNKKLILSLNADHARSVNVSDTLSDYEASLINKYMIVMVNNFEQRRALLEQNNHILFLNPQPNTRDYVLTGPLSDNYTIFNLQGEKLRGFEAEPNYAYLFEPDLLKQTSIPTKYPFGRILSNAVGTDDYSQYVLTEARADSIWQQYLDNRCNTQQLFVNEPVKTAQSGKFKFERDVKLKEIPALIKNIIIYKYDDPDFIRIYPGNTTDFDLLQQGNYRLLFLLKGDMYYIKENIVIKPYGTNYYKARVMPVHPRDSVSIKINKIIESRTGRHDNSDNEIVNDALKIKEAFNERYLNDSLFTKMVRGKVIGSDDKLPVVGASLRVKGTNIGVVTNVNGDFTLKAPASGKLVVSFIGYITQEVEFEDGENLKISLTPSAQELREVVVTGYGTQLKRDMTGSISVVNSLQGKAAGVIVTTGAPGSGSQIYIRGVANSGGQQPLYIVDGVPVKSLAGLLPDQITDINILKSAAAVALYGSEAANGVVVITTSKPKVNNAAAPSQKTDDQSIRKNFSDYAYWQPKLTTDANGKASFMSTFPDDITNWRTFVIAANGQKQTGYVEHQIKSYKPLSATFIAPLFAVQGDELSAIGKVTNYNTDPIKLTRSFTYNGKLLKQDAFEVKNTKIDTLNVTAANTDSLTFGYTIKRDNGYFDGERRKIPVVEQGVKETKGIFEALNKDTTVTMQFDPAFGPVTFRAEASALPALAEEAQHLRDYKYLCNEQLASKLKGLLAEKRICAYLGQPFKYERNILEGIKKLQENRRSQGTWGWWKDTDEELWISLHAVEALLDAQKEGYTIDIDLSRLTEYLVYQLESYKGEEKLACLQLLRKINAKADYAKYFGVIDKENTGQKVVSKYNQFRLMLLKQEAGRAVKLDSIFLTERHTLFGNIYWGEDSYRFFDNPIQLSVLAYQIIKNEGKHLDQLQKIRGYFLEQRHTGEWRNTYETSLILETILPDLLKNEKSIQPASLVIKGAKTDTITKFPYTATLTDRSVSISKTGALPVYVTGFQQFWNSNPVKVSKDFTVDSWFEKNGNKLTQLKGGEPVLLKAEVTAKGDADYVMIEIPIPAGCSYESKEQAWQNNEVHREYFKEKVSIFCRKLKQGKYTFTVNLMPRYDGKYTLNPAKAEMMYFPVFYGREGMRQVVIGSSR